MRKLSSIFSILVFFAFAACIAQDREKQLYAENCSKIDKAQKEFFEFVDKSGSKDPEVEALLKEFKKRLESGKLVFEVERGEQTVFPALNVKNGEKGCLLVPVNAYLMDNYKDYPSIMYSSFIFFAAQHKGNSLAGKKHRLNETERLIKSCELQARFVDKYLSKSKLKLTPYEKAILASYRDNNLYDFMFKYYALDAEWLDYLKEIFTAENSVSGKLRQLNDIGLKKIDESVLKLRKDAPREDVYYALVMPAMYCSVLPYLVYELVQNNKTENSFTKFKYEAAAPQLAKTVEKLKEVIEPFSDGLDYSQVLAENIRYIPKGTEVKVK
jgi:hypothetical protein